MKTTVFLSICLISLALCSCKTKTNNLFDEICGIKPNNWECKIIENNFDSVPLPNGLENPKAVIEFDSSDKSVSNPIYLFLYDISKKPDLEKIIQEKMKEANCVPVFFAENKEFYVITSSCYINDSFFLQNTNLKSLVKKVFTRHDEGIVR